MMRYIDILLLILGSVAIVSCDNSADNSANTHQADSLEITNQPDLIQIGASANLVPIQELVSTTLPILSDELSQLNGDIQNCLDTVPCTWTSSDQQAAVTIIRADNIATRSRLAIDYKITTLHDSSLLITQSSKASLSDGIELTSNEIIFADESISSPKQITAGNELTGVAIFNDSADSHSINSWNLTFLDGGTQRASSFTTIPIGTRAQYQADCEMILPCSWTDPERSMDITLINVTPQQATQGMELSFEIRTAFAETVFIKTGSTALGLNEIALDALGHSLGTLNSLDTLSMTTEPNNQLIGSINFYPTTAIPQGLEWLQLKMHNASNSPHWNPRFINVPTVN